jgi:hypothetical protein
MPVDAAPGGRNSPDAGSRAGVNVQGAVTAAQNETLNNFCGNNACGRFLFRW